MKNFPDGIQFKYPWRKYQQQFLDGLDGYFTDRHLHVVAPPGSGKTVLGLEIMLRLNTPTLIVAPTIAIREQWIQRLCELFLQQDEVPEWISTSIREPKFMTVVTYQGIHAAVSLLKDMEESEEETEETVSDEKVNSKELSQVISKLKKTGVKTMILDEAHHLKKAWWASLTDIKNELDPVLVALTATPPYDVSPLEWQRYISLNGPVDAEISVPELMIEGDLCPHQDLVHISLPSVEENEKLEKIQQRAQKYWKEFMDDEAVLEALKNYSVYQNPSLSFDWIYDHISSYSSGLVFLNFKKVEINPIHFEILGDSQKLIPEFSFFWLEELLDLLLFVDRKSFFEIESHLENWENKLRHGGFLEHKTVNFLQNKTASQILNSSVGKLSSILEIVQLEHQQLQSDLRMVILTDYIRKDFLDAKLDLSKIGAIPIFELLRRNNSNHFLVGMLTGSLVIVPKSLEFDLKNVNSTAFFEVEELAYDTRYCIVKLNSQNRSQIVKTITDLFQKGGLTILVGTKSLLGEGWDAPKINSLILASTVGSFVLSNQMRGRAIRIDKDNPNKSSNIWHIATFNEHSFDGGNDWVTLNRRFKTFVGISNTDAPLIQNSMERLGISETIENTTQIENINQVTENWATNRTSIKTRWQEALKHGNTMVEEIVLPTEIGKEYQERKVVYAGKSAAHFAMISLSTLFAFGGELLSSLIKNFYNPMLSQTFLFAGVCGILVYGIRFFKSFRLFLRFRHIQSHILTIGKILLKTLVFERIARTPLDNLTVVTSYSKEGVLGCHLHGGNQYEKSQFIQNLQEIVSPIDNPRYLLEEKYGFLSKSSRYYQVPEALGKNKKTAAYFATEWQEKFGKTNLIFTRTIEGRKVLLKLRFKNILKSNIQIKHLHTWTR